MGEIETDENFGDKTGGGGAIDRGSTVVAFYIQVQIICTIH